MKPINDTFLLDSKHGIYYVDSKSRLERITNTDNLIEGFNYLLKVEVKSVIRMHATADKPIRYYEIEIADFNECQNVPKKIFIKCQKTFYRHDILIMRATFRKHTDSKGRDTYIFDAIYRDNLLVEVPE